jgi:hypothetical protein
MVTLFLSASAAPCGRLRSAGHKTDAGLDGGTGYRAAQPTRMLFLTATNLVTWPRIHEQSRMVKPVPGHSARNLEKYFFAFIIPNQISLFGESTSHPPARITSRASHWVRLICACVYVEVLNTSGNGHVLNHRQPRRAHNGRHSSRSTPRAVFRSILSKPPPSPSTCRSD